MIFFGTDGIRGEAFKSLPLIRAYQLGFALKEIFEDSNVVIGYDTRESSLNFLHALIQGLNKKKVKVAGVVTTPMVALHSKIESCIGVMITASHNPYYDNGLKVFLNGMKINDVLIKKIENKMIQVNYFKPKKINFEINKDTEMHYLNFIDTLNFKMTFKDYVIDASNGSAHKISHKLFNGKIYFDRPNGKNINKNCGCTNISFINQLNTKSSVSFSFDGDGDRVLMTINKNIIYGDQITYIIVKDMIEKGNFPNVALSVMTNPGVVEAFRKLNINTVDVNVGDKNIIKEINKNNVQLGSEPSGHIILDYGSGIHLGDGILIARKLIDIISRYGLQKIISWLDEITLYPIRTKNLKIDKRLLKNSSVKKCINKIIRNKEETDKIIIRASGTEDLVRITVSTKLDINLNSKINDIEKCFRGEIL